MGEVKEIDRWRGRVVNAFRENWKTNSFGRLAIKVWQPDAETRQRRELLSSYQRCVKESTRAQQHLRSFLNEHALRLPKGFPFELLSHLHGMDSHLPFAAHFGRISKSYCDPRSPQRAIDHVGGQLTVGHRMFTLLLTLSRGSAASPAASPHQRTRTYT